MPRKKATRKILLILNKKDSADILRVVIRKAAEASLLKAAEERDYCPLRLSFAPAGLISAIMRYAGE